MKLAQELLDAIAAAHARGVRDTDIAAKALKHKEALSRLIRRLRERAEDPGARSLEEDICEAIDEEILVVPTALAEEVRRLAREHREALARGGVSARRPRTG